VRLTDRLGLFPDVAAIGILEIIGVVQPVQ